MGYIHVYIIKKLRVTSEQNLHVFAASYCEHQMDAFDIPASGAAIKYK